LSFNFSRNHLIQQGGIFMKKVLLADGAGFLRFCAVLAALGTWLFLAPSSSFAQTYSLEFIGLPTGNVDLTQYIGLDRKLKADVPGQILRITIAPPLTPGQTRNVRLSLTVSAQGTSVSQCNGQIATALTGPFTLSGAGRDLGSAAFTGTGGIPISSSSTSQPCIDAFADKMTSGIASLPTGIYRIDAVLNDAGGALLGTGSHTIEITGASTNEAVLNLTSPLNGDQVPSTGSVVFSFDNSLPGRLLAFEHSSFSQSPDDATRDLNSPLKALDVPVTALGSNQVNALYPGVALRSWTPGKKYSWMFLGSVPGSTDVRRSPVWSFVVVPNDPILAQLVLALMNAPDPIGSTYNNLVNSGYMLALSGSNPIFLQEGDNGIPRAIDVSQVLAWLADLAHRDVRVNAVVTQ
jgi:hypothetical protein